MTEENYRKPPRWRNFTDFTDRRLCNRAIAAKKLRKIEILVSRSDIPLEDLFLNRPLPVEQIFSLRRS